jgi:tetrahydromethanopterin S-methyltransferase subunit G
MVSSTTTELEKQSLEAHVDLCAIRYEQLDKRLIKVEEKLDNIADEMKIGNSSLIKVMIGAAGTIVAGLLSTIVVILMQAG